MADMKEKKSFSRKKVVGLLSLLVLVILGTTLAYYSSTHSLSNPLRTTHSEVQIVEEFNPTSSFLPGETVIKKVAFQNTGNMDVYLRVKVPPTEGWYDKGKEVSENAKDVEYKKLLTERVIKNWTQYWDPDHKLNTEGNTSCEWSEEINGYRYYKKILKKSGETGSYTNDILESIKLSEEVSNDRHSANYSDKVYKLTFEAEAIPVEAEGGQYGIQTIWGMTCTESDGTLTWSKVTSTP